jgi:hypothetical protein
VTLEIRPLDPDDPDVRKLALIDLAVQRGVPWGSIAAVLGAVDKQRAKKIRAQLEKRIKAKQRAVPAASELCERDEDHVH